MLLLLSYPETCYPPFKGHGTFSMKRYFINTKSGSNKFWYAALQNKTLIVSFGKAGTAGRQLKKEFANKVACKAAFDKLMKAKTAKGYTEINSPQEVAPKTVSSFSSMNKKEFWNLINTSLQCTGLQRQSRYLKKQLLLLQKKDLAAFENIFNRLDDAAYTWPLWAAAYTIHAGCSDDGFSDFRAWLITRGQKVYAQALARPDSLSEISPKKLAQSREGDYFLYLAGGAYEALYNEDIRYNKYAKPFKAKTKPTGRKWKEGDTGVLTKLNPRLFRLFKSKWQ